MNKKNSDKFSSIPVAAKLFNQIVSDVRNFNGTWYRYHSYTGLLAHSVLKFVPILLVQKCLVILVKIRNILVVLNSIIFDR